jgi:hypothetical protein
MDDLAEIIEYNEELSRLLMSIAPEGTTMADRFRQIETFRLKLDAAVPFDEDDLEKLIGYHQDFQRSLSKPKKFTKSAKAPEPADEKRPPPVEPVKPPPPVEPVKPPPPVEPVTPPPPVEPVKPPAEPAEAAKAGPGADAAPEFLAEPTPGPKEEALPEDVEEEEHAGDRGRADSEVDELGAADIFSDDLGTDVADSEPEGLAEPADEKVDSGVLRAAEEAAADDDLALEAVQAMAEDDHAEVLRILHREVMSVAEHVVKGDVDQEFSVWQTITVSGWFDLKKEALGLASIESFFSIAEEIRTRHRAGESEDDIKAFIAESEVTKLLLSLGETFKRQNL